MDNLEHEIYATIKEYPILYYFGNFEDSKIAVLNHLFLTIGNGIQFEIGKGISSYRLKLKDEEIDKINNNIPIREYERIDFDKSKKSNKIYPELEYRKKNCFFKNEEPFVFKNAVEDFSDLPNVVPDYCYSEYPKNDNKSRDCRPYPFSMWYCPVIKMSPHMSKYEYSTIENITIEEIKDGLDLFPGYYIKHIRFIFEWALSFYSSEKFYEDSYYNWEPTNSFIRKFHIEGVKKMCQDYGIKEDDYSLDDFVKTVIEKTKNSYISNCEKIVNSTKLF